MRQTQLTRGACRSGRMMPDWQTCRGTQDVIGWVVANLTERQAFILVPAAKTLTCRKAGAPSTEV